jgi:hypothetical protein
VVEDASIQEHLTHLELGAHVRQRAPLFWNFTNGCPKASRSAT